MRQRSGVYIETLRLRRPPSRPVSDGDARALRHEPAVHDPAVERPSVFGVSQHDDAVPANPLIENREIAARERVGPAFGLTPAEDEHGAIPLEILPGEMRIEAAVLDVIAGRMPRSRGRLEGQPIRERQGNDEKATRLRLARAR